MPNTAQRPAAWPARPQWQAPWAVGLVYTLAFLALDWVSYLRPMRELNITPWNPEPALAVALLIWNRRWLPLVWLSIVLADVWVRGWPSYWAALALSAVCLSGTYLAMAHAMERRLDRSLAMATRQDVGWFCVIVVLGCLCSAVAFVSVYAAAGMLDGVTWLEAVLRYWVGDAVGLLVTLPVLLVLTDPARRHAMAVMLRRLHWWLILAVIAGILWAVFGRAGHDHFKYFYLLLLPVVWAAASLGVPGAVVASALTQLALVAMVQAVPTANLTVFELQMLMAAVALTGLLLGVTVDESARAASELRGSLRLAAAGQMAAALAHELSQPLTALSGYAQACRMLLTSGEAMEPARLSQLVDVSRHLVEDAHRASQVVKRLRDFFRSGSTQLQRTAPKELLQDAMAAHHRRAELLKLNLRLDVAADLPDVWLDPVQITVVLRNLIANAMDAASNVPGTAEVSLRATALDQQLRIDVVDSGPGVSTAKLQSLFEPGPSDKPGGMGVGLSICRAIIEAHGGKLWAQAGPSGCFSFTLPMESPSDIGGKDAS